MKDMAQVHCLDCFFFFLVTPQQKKEEEKNYNTIPGSLTAESISMLRLKAMAVSSEDALGSARSLKPTVKMPINAFYST